MESDSPSASGRSKREKKDKFGRFAALQKLKGLKGTKHKYEVEQIDNVYDEVDEKEFVKTLTERQQSDWIVDDGDGGYVEDGREIFDDDLDDESIQKATKQNLAGPRKRKREEPKSKGNIMNMLQGMPSKKKCEEKVSSTNDDILASMLKELESDKSTSKLKPAPKNKFSVSAKTHSKPVTPKSLKASVEEEKVEKSPELEKTIFDVTSPVSKQKGDIRPKAIFGSKPQLDSQIIKEKDFEIENSEESESQSKTKEIQSTSQVIDVQYSQYVHDFPEADFACMDADEFAQGSVESALSKQKVDAETQKFEKPKNNLKISEENEYDQLLCDVDDDTFWSAMANENVSNSTTILSKSSTQAKISLPLVQNKAGEEILRFYWLDASEDPFKQPGTVHLYGKIHLESSNTFVSCCLTVKDVPRRIYCLPREKMKTEEGEKLVSMHDVYTEWSSLATRQRINEFRSAAVTKSYSFEREGTPLQSEYLEVRYSASFPVVDSNYQGNAIEHIFGSSVNSLELFLIERDIKGPCWLEVKSASLVQTSGTWSEMHVSCEKMENISVYREEGLEAKKLVIPPMAMATLNIRTTLNSKSQQNEIAMIAVLIHTKYQIDKPPLKPPFEQHYCFVTHPKDTPWPLYARDNLSKFRQTKVIFCETESDLLEKFLNLFQKIDPDFLIGYDCGFQFDVLVRRLTDLKIKYWTRTSKLKRTYVPLIKGKVNLAQSFCGRPICDLQVSAKEVNLKVRSYDLDTLCKTVLKTKSNTIVEIKPADCPQFYSEAEKILGLIKITMMEANYMITLIGEMNIIPLALQITCIAGNVISRTLSAGRAERNEFLLLHAFAKKGYITPDRRYTAKKSEMESTKKKAAYAGGLVLDPKKGFYDQLILLMDFNSLYPSIIQEYNLCFTTIPGACYRELETFDLPGDGIEVGVIPTEIRKLVESRGEVKKLLKSPNLSPELKMQYNIRQLALKLTANSMYGCLGASHCRFYAKNLAALVTGKGREILQNTKSLVEKLNYDVIYGDTDSIMINSKILNYDEAFSIARKIKLEVNKLYKRVELDIDGVFKYMLLLNKKKYAAVSMVKLPSGKYEYETEIKGLDIVRRDWCQLASDTGRKVIDHIFMDLSIEEKTSKIRDLLEKVAADVRSNSTPLSSLVITKQLSKNPKDYPDKRQPHVAVALRLNQAGGRMWKAGDTVPYIICLDNTTRTPIERAYHINEFKKSEDLAIDIDYYLRLQIIPVLERITTPLPELNGGFLAECLGITDYKPKISASSNSATSDLYNNEDDDSKNDADRFENCEPFTFRCRDENCNSLIVVKGFMTEDSDPPKPTMLACSNPECKLLPWKYIKAIQNDLQLAIRSKITKYYQQVITCDNPGCATSTRSFRSFANDRLPRCIKCLKRGVIREYSETAFYNQLNFFHHIFDASQENKDSKEQNTEKYPPEMMAACDTLKEFVDSYLRRNSYCVIDFNKLFYFTKKKPWDPKVAAAQYALQNPESKFERSRKILDDLAAGVSFHE